MQGVGAGFRFILERADHWRTSAIEWSYQLTLTRESGIDHLLGFVLVVSITALATACSAWIVRRFSPESSGSGIPHVEAVLKQESPPASLLLIPVKFVGGILAMGAGLALGREGPTVQMGATLAHAVGKLFRVFPEELGFCWPQGLGQGWQQPSTLRSQVRCLFWKN